MSMVILQQHFPLGHFHANPWKAFPFDDPYGEWPPSPWRLIRALIARSHQFAREEPSIGRDDLAALVRAFCTSSIRWHLPGAVVAWSGFAAVSTCSVQPRSQISQRTGSNGVLHNKEPGQLLAYRWIRKLGLVVH